ncbi:hypothetical protein [Variovorax ginsengisoli]|uniref:Uncharacterized protein n=1 Tax=Variovorax ginsengisoli TaxID=363844 RepID=A0ABT9SFQ6_9BURK|nr:hypothetical protein [Variovorax ginsengisoli]MDP9902626.1 hypothetical protein [Variovorax ginsengisoli]
MDAEKQKAEEGRQIKLIRDSLPGVHQAIRERAAVEGNDVYATVRRGLRGEPDCFYAFEGGRIVGTPFATTVTADLAAQIVQFGATFLFMLAPTARKDAHGPD